MRFNLLLTSRTLQTMPPYIPFHSSARGGQAMDPRLQRERSVSAAAQIFTILRGESIF